MKRLLVMRHAKSDWAAGARDHDRPLNERGRTAAATMGRVIRDAGEVPDVALSSTAVRARTTLELAAAAGEWDTRTELHDDLYATDVDTALQVASRGSGERLMIVGHEPTWSALVGRLTGGSVAVKTATVVAIDVHASDWVHLPGASGEIAYVLQPRLFDDG